MTTTITPRTNISVYGLRIVQEKMGRYDIAKKVGGPIEAVKIANLVFDIENQAEEILVMLTLDTKNNITGAFEVSRGSLNASLVHPREVYKRALLQNAFSVMILHNHPSGDSTPSREDKDITRRLVDAGNMIGIKLLDHIVVTRNGYTSFKAENML